MKHKELSAWLKFHDIRTGKFKRYERLNREKLLALAERTWNVIQKAIPDQVQLALMSLAFS